MQLAIVISRHGPFEYNEYYFSCGVPVATPSVTLFSLRICYAIVLPVLPFEDPTIDLVLLIVHANYYFVSFSSFPLRILISEEE